MGYPAQYGGRLSLVVDVKLCEGNRDSAVVSGGLGLIASRPAFEASTNKSRGGRCTRFDVFTR